LFNKNSVFDISGNNSANQTAVTMFSRSGNMNQKFSYYTDGKIKALAGKCLDSGSGNLGDWIRINDCTGGWNQKWNVNRDYSINQVNSNNNQTYCIGTDNGATNGNPRLVLKSCANINDCSTYWEIENISDYSPSLVNAQGCGSFSNGSNNNNSTLSTPPSYTPPSPTPNPTPGGGGTSGSILRPLSFTSSMKTFENQYSGGYIEVKTPSNNPPTVDSGKRQAKAIIDYFSRLDLTTQICIQGSAAAALINPVAGAVAIGGCAAISSTFRIAVNNISIALGEFFRGFGDGVWLGVNPATLFESIQKMFTSEAIAQGVIFQILGPLAVTITAAMSVPMVMNNIAKFSSQDLFVQVYMLGKFIGQAAGSALLGFTITTVGGLAASLVKALGGAGNALLAQVAADMNTIWRGLIAPELAAVGGADAYYYQLNNGALAIAKVDILAKLNFAAANSGAGITAAINTISNSNVASQVFEYFRNRQRLQSHYNNHASEFGNITIDQYLDKANNFMSSTDSNILGKYKSDGSGDYVKYNPITNEFMSIAVEPNKAVIKTYFKPTGGLDYFNRQ
jgi:Ricin-type beta-trefoil lectin domain